MPITAVECKQMIGVFKERKVKAKILNFRHIYSYTSEHTMENVQSFSAFACFNMTGPAKAVFTPSDPVTSNATLLR